MIERTQRNRKVQKLDGYTKRKYGQFSRKIKGGETSSERMMELKHT